jgi:hypothetical protein
MHVPTQGIIATEERWGLPTLPPDSWCDMADSMHRLLAAHASTNGRQETATDTSGIMQKDHLGVDLEDRLETVMLDALLGRSIQKQRHRHLSHFESTLNRYFHLGTGGLDSSTEGSSEAGRELDCSLCS